MMGDNSRHIPLAVIVCLLAGRASAQEKKPAPKEEKDSGMTELRIEVTGDDNKPVDNASVYVKYVHERPILKDKRIEMNVKTNREGVAKVPEVPRGKILVQVIASGWKTFGRWYDATQEQQTIKIKLDKPTKWY